MPPLGVVVVGGSTWTDMSFQTVGLQGIIHVIATMEVAEISLIRA
jgi:hypothetical protein